MAKKIIIVGPPGAGKTTLRKIFFEGENSTKLLEYALEPTHGEESLILRLPGLNEDLGVFDLAGQENQRWLETDEKAIFYNTKVILIVIDITVDLDFMIEFIKKILEIRETITPSTMIYVLLHKIDLIKEKRIREIKDEIIRVFNKEKLIKVLFTSLKREYFTSIFSNFIEILKTCVKTEQSDELLEFNVIDESIKIINIIENEITISRENLIKKLNLPQNLITYLIESLINKGHIKIKKIEGYEILSLTDIGRKNFKQILTSFSSNNLVKVNNRLEIKEDILNKQIPAFIGALIADKDGKTLYQIELYENALKNFILSDISTQSPTTSTDLDLIPMFISALEKFSLELNIHDLTGFNLSGSNIKMQVFPFENITVTLFMNPHLNIKSIKSNIDKYFKTLIKDYNEEFNNSIITGNITDLFPLIEKGKKWLEDLNKHYEDMIINLEIFDIEHAKILYDQMDNLYNDINIEFAIILDKIKKLKVNLMKGILEKDYDELKNIAKIAQNLLSKYAS